MDVETELNSIGGDMCALTEGGCAYMPKDNGIVVPGGWSGTAGQFQPPPAPPPPPKEKCAIANNFLQRAGIAALGWLARVTGKSVGLGLGGSIGAGVGLGATLSVSRQVVVSPSGRAAFVTAYGFPYPAGATLGAGALGGFQLSLSNATDPGQLAGTSFDAGGSGDFGIGAGLDFSSAEMNQATLTVGAGAGLRFGAGATLDITNVAPICGHRG